MCQPCPESRHAERQRVQCGRRPVHARPARGRVAGGSPERRAAVQLSFRYLPEYDCGLMNEFEVYPSAPVVLVAFEVRHPIADPLTPAESRAVKRQLADVLPLETQAQVANVHITPGVPPEMTSEKFPRFFNRRKTLSASFKEGSIVVEASDYPGWREFRELITLAIQARTEISAVDGIDRLGLRYIDEIRVPGDGPVDWSQWVAPSLLAPNLADIDLPISQWQGVSIYGSQPGQMLVARYGPRVGHAIDPDSDLRRIRGSDGGEFFLVDIDSFWTPDGDVPEFDTKSIQQRSDELHRPVRRLFESTITDKLRNEVLRKDA